MKKTISIERLYYSITPYLFILLMGGFIAYHIAVGYGLFPAFLGGYFGIASVVVAAIYVLRLPNTLKLNIQYAPALSFLHISIFLIAFVTTIISSTYQDIPNETVTQSYNTLVLWTSLFLLGFHLLRSNTKKTVRLSFIFYFLFFGFVAIYFINTKSLIFDLKLLADADADTVSGYQSLARNLLVISILLICYSSRTPVVLFLILSSSFLFFYLGARSEFVAFLFFGSLFMILKTRHQKKYLLTIIAIILGLMALSYIFKEDLMSSRQLQLLDLKDSGSWLAREELEQKNIKIIQDHPILGSFGGHALATGDIGGYAHNSLSAYVNYGLVFWLGYTWLCVYTTFSSLRKLLKNSGKQHWWYSFSVNAVCLLLIVFAKPVFWVIPFFAWGVYFSARTLGKR
ncbi:hypothetical protein [Psychrobacter sp. UBA2514]|jgi:hypothetical protein|uniref:hypothetical protein n=1 Tax=Psychrobacter sp. UBA2514 TaxID=1947346 RepID=UPI00257E2A58|nr:hypothetical protein [Psychrobacter sp. UBA2514]|tara:strand:+ start:2922 stop:4121 length:1200 start_codon:yes stop_codon:yes gene_type:complete